MMFGIAGVTALAIKNNTQAVFTNVNSHLKYLNSDNRFNPSLNHAEQYNDLNFIKSLSSGSKPAKAFAKYSFPFHYEDIVIKQIPAIIDGFFQSEKYFVQYRKQMLSLFKPTDFISEYINDKYEDIINCRSTSVHVRRGDYLKLQTHHPTLPVSYYEKAIEYMTDRTDQYVIFSDDISWCRSQFVGDNFTFVEDVDYIELYLMSMCHNNIIANSSFSWWGAWLNDNNKLAIGPDCWFGPSIRHATKDIIPEAWIKF